MAADLADEAEARAAADSTETAQRIAADNTLQGNIESVQGDVNQNEADSDSADEALAADLADEAEARAAADSTETAQRIAADNTLQGNIESVQGDVNQNEADSDAADEAMADDIADNEFRIAAAAADMGFVTSTVGSVNNVPQHPGYAGAEQLQRMLILLLLTWLLMLQFQTTLKLQLTFKRKWTQTSVKQYCRLHSSSQH